MEQLTTFINIQTDYGFKRMFGTPKNKRILIRFLNALLGDTICVTDVVYHDKEMLPEDENGKRIIYDVYCTSQGENHHFILEMQNFYEPPFADRVLYYTTKIIAGQGKKGWDYKLKPVISIVVMDFDLKKMTKSLIHDMQMVDVKTGDVLSDKVRVLLLSLKQIEAKKWEECGSEIERLMFLIKNMDKLEKSSEIYRSKEYQDMFDAAETHNMVNEELVAYSESLQRMRDYQSGLDYARKESFDDGVSKGIQKGREEGIKKGREEGIKKGREEGREEERMESIRFMLSIGVAPEVIAKQYGMTAEELLGLMRN
ncbi:MAG: Rpn family recombination-promoting nuclease/putative transposase [Muribaculaceae bacterium]|nr:Rpn family recombination-promoting nuclease/putative transposase [Muribaculaceae bacterium]